MSKRKTEIDDKALEKVSGGREARVVDQQEPGSLKIQGEGEPEKCVPVEHPPQENSC